MRPEPSTLLTFGTDAIGLAGNDETQAQARGTSAVIPSPSVKNLPSSDQLLHRFWVLPTLKAAFFVQFWMLDPLSRRRLRFSSASSDSVRASSPKRLHFFLLHFFLDKPSCDK